jgi:phosphatidylserine/phosphatidylglycerophosphate/cardiolipin synthase-like enzyme/uncharacterized membrane protein YdjX (TVP38/TMEM64 family)
VLVDGAAYYGALRAALRGARHQVTIIGWDIDSRTRLVGAEGHAEDGLPETLSAFLAALTGRNPELTVRLLLWDYSVLYALERELLPTLSLRWSTPRRVEFCLDDTVPPGASHHQKLVVVDDALAFIGGLDLTVRRWDTRAHTPWDPHRVDPLGKPYPPFHDVQLMLEGPAAAALGELARERWSHAACEEMLPAPESGAPPPWPDRIEADFTDIAIGIARTRPAQAGAPEIREVEKLFADMIASAEQAIYLENQFLTNLALAEALIARLRARPALQVLMVAPRTHHTWLEHRTMQAGRIRFMAAFRAAGVQDRVRLMAPVVRGRGGRADVMVHAKLMVVDDTLLRIGSANFNHRSMGTDTECDAVIAARCPSDRAGIRAIRDGLIAEHCGTTPRRVAEAIAGEGSLLAGLDAVNSNRQRGLRPIEDGELGAGEAFPGIEEVADPKSPLAGTGLLADITAEPPPHHLPSWLRLALLALPLVLLASAWQFTPLHGLLQPEAVKRSLLQAGGMWGPGLALCAFLLLGLVFFPLNVLILGTAAAFGAWPGLAYASCGALVSAAATYFVGRRLGPTLLRDLLGPRINRVVRGIDRNGVMAVTMTRLMPVAPFTLVNLVAGAIRVKFIDYMLGTVLGLVPGIVLMSLLGDRLTRIVSDPTLADIAIFLGILVVWALLSLGLQRLLSRLRRRPPA